ncbi:MAG: TIGR02530 family flagellar biosynthesis protein [Angelakisella sp.]
MDYKPFDRFSVPITTGVPRIPVQKPVTKSGETGEASFSDILRSQLSQSNVEFSKHAVSRVLERNIPISPANLERLSSGVELARGKGLNDTLILIDKTAYLVSVKNSKVITTVSGDELSGNVFTNIDGTVII